LYVIIHTSVCRANRQKSPTLAYSLHEDVLGTMGAAQSFVLLEEAAWIEQF
jgi:hypothetical protein